MADENWLNTKTVSCNGCGEKLDLSDPSPMNEGYYLGCDSCRNQVEVSIYDSNFDQAELALKTKGISEDQIDYFDLLMAEIGNRLEKCSCGGTFSISAPNRCIYCAQIIEGSDPEQLVWYHCHDDSTKEAIEKGEAQMGQFILAPKWKA